MSDTTTKPKTKAELIEILIGRGSYTRSALSRMTRDALAAQAEDAESTEFLAAEEASQKAEKPTPVAAPPALTGDLLLPVESVLAGDVWGGRKVKEIQTGPKWSYLRDTKDVWFLRVPSGQEVLVTRK